MLKGLFRGNIGLVLLIIVIIIIPLIFMGESEFEGADDQAEGV